MPVVLLAVAVFAFAPTRVPGQTLPSSEWVDQRIAVLRNGEVFEGRIARAGDRYVVHVNGGLLSVRASDVEFLAESLQEAYLRKRELVQPDDAQGHTQLADWCQRRGMLTEAKAQIADARRADPNFPMIGLIERRIEMSTVQQVTPLPATKAPAQTVSSAELQRMVRGMPAGTVERFAQTVQPLLMNNCTASNCHGPQTSSNFSLLRTPVGQPASRRTTQRNLSAVLERINRGDPGESPLLTYPIRPHGTARTAVFNDYQVGQYKELVDWVYRVARAPSPVQEATPASHEESPATPPAVTPAVFQQEQEAPADDSDPDAMPGLKIDGPTPAGSAAEATFGTEKPKVQRGAATQGFSPADPFDPEVFNRRYFPSGAGGSQP